MAHGIEQAAHRANRVEFDVGGEDDVLVAGGRARPGAARVTCERNAVVGPGLSDPAPRVGSPPSLTASEEPTMDWKLELVPVPVADVDRAKAFYVDQVGFVADHDHRVHEGLRFVQLTPPGSACSVVLGTGITEMEPGSQRGLQMVVSDVGEARRQLLDRGVAASEVDVQPWGSFVTFSDPDGNTWALQQLPPPA